MGILGFSCGDGDELYAAVAEKCVGKCQGERGKSSDEGLAVVEVR